jgi:pimeloyl-ACP methyl ester carboxylesterase
MHLAMEVTAQIAIAPDGTGLSWSSTGSGGPPLLLCDGVGCAGYVWRPLLPGLSRDRRVIHWNYRAHGASASPRDPERMTVADCVSDLLAVLDAAGERRAVLAGHSMGVQVVLEAHRRAPERVAGLVLLCGAPGHVIDTFHDRTTLRHVFPWVRRLVLRYPELARLAFRAVVPTEFALQYALAFEVDAARVDRADLVRYLQDLGRVDPTLFVRLLASAAEHDATEHLSRVNVPALVVAGERDSFTPMRRSLDMHRRLPGSELLVVPGGTHVAPLEDPGLVAARVRGFLSARVPVEAPRPAPAPTPAEAAKPRPPRKRAARAPGSAAASRPRAHGGARPAGKRARKPPRAR